MGVSEQRLTRNMDGLFRLLRSRPSQSSDESGSTELHFSGKCDVMRGKRPPLLFEIARVFVRFDHVASVIGKIPMVKS